MKKRHLLIMISFGCLVLLARAADTGAQQAESIGNVAAVQRQVEVMHPGESGVSLVNLGSSVLFKDTYETKSQARLKLLFEDDSILSLGENTRLQIAENIYDPAQKRRSTVIKMLNGSMRALVGKIFGGPGSKFEIHTPTAAAAARGTYFIVWTSKEGGQDPTGVVNIGETGKVAVSNIDPAVEGSVVLDQNQYTLVEEGKPPIPASKISPGLLRGLLGSTEVKDQAVEEIPNGTEAPGSDVSDIVVTPFPSGQPTGGETGGPLILPTLPPILQQPSTDKTPVSVNVNFPGQ
jgi:FecR protein